MKKINTILRRLELFTGGVLLLIILINIIINVVMRYFFRRPIFWSEELSNYSFAWMGYLAFTYIQSVDKHIRLTLFLNRMPEIMKLSVNIIFNLVILVVLASLFIPAIRSLRYLFPTPAFRIHAGIFQAIGPFCFVLIIVHCFVNVLTYTEGIKSQIAKVKD